MGQDDIYKLLKSNPKKWFSLKEISDTLSISVNRIYIGTTKLCKRDTTILKRRDPIFCKELGPQFRYAKEFDE